jgi:cystathionine beta-lyase
MTQFDFDTPFAKQDLNSTKWEFEVNANHLGTHTDHAHPKHGADRMLPLWVADMDFHCPPAVTEAVVARAQKGIFGYAMPDDGYFEAVIGWFARRYGWETEKEWILQTPGVVSALHMIVQRFTQPGEKVLIQRPVYYPFTDAIVNNGRIVVSNSLVVDENDRYTIDFDDFEQKAADTAVRLFILCSPHNPVGRVWTREELTCMGEICLKHNVLVFADEIHADLIMSGHRFTAYATLGPEFADNCLVANSASKTFNLAGFKTSNIVIPNSTLRDRFLMQRHANGIWGATTMGVVATQAAYRHGEPWLTAVLAYIEDNYHLLDQFVREQLPQLTLTPLEGTYLAWLNCEKLGLSPTARQQLLKNDAKLMLNKGSKFGPEGASYERINLACHRSILVEALERLAQVIDD